MTEAAVAAQPTTRRGRLVELWHDRIVRDALLIAVGTRVMLFGLVWMALRILPQFPNFPAQLPDSFLPSHPGLDGWARWDTAHYVALAMHGYGPANPSLGDGLGFFPLYSLMLRGLVWMLGVEPTAGALAAAGIVISNICFLIAVPLFAKLAERQVGADAARVATLLLCVSPFSYFFNAAYTESLFLLLALGSLMLADRQRTGWAAALAGVASASRLVGLALTPALLFILWKRKAPLRDWIVTAVLAPAGYAAYALYTWIRWDDPLAFFTAQSNWGGWDEHVRFYIELFLLHPRDAIGGDPRHLVIILNVALLGVWLACLPAVWRRVDPGLAMFTTLLVVMQGTMTWVSLGRYLVPAAGTYLVLGVWFSRGRLAGAPRDLLVVLSAMLMSVLAVLFGLGYWVI